MNFGSVARGLGRDERREARSGCFKMLRLLTLLLLLAGATIQAVQRPPREYAAGLLYIAETIRPLTAPRASSTLCSTIVERVPAI